MKPEENIPGLTGYQDELADLLESNLANKDVHVERLQQYYADDAEDIAETYQLWQDLDEVKVPQVSESMDANFYKMLSSVSDQSALASTQPASVVSMFSAKWIAIAATFIIGLMAGNWLDFGQSSVEQEPISVTEESSFVGFASLEQTPSASARIKGINEVQSQDRPDLKIIDALNQVILHDPNVNVRLTAIETMVFFSEIPEARAYLIEAIPHQESAIVQLELADVMIALEEEGSVDQWNELLQSDKTDTETRIHLKESLRKLL